ncbi:SIS domain-containing protein [Nocardiopsis sp. L17-MgMaSL7]|jgi:D-sedoheptulose 7-phosphate isomerase|uniref:D-sedoheptulose-7-phosphate isomerase n=1 Tax=Nocardiopsis sp. L17-MgMaSL7 TaxID=1938893 RepID=UPI000D71B4CF|nr:SIS domain-containing protein [Nocardiopsis sp. L17-MgMaSL7]PWV55431.1 phosphoheptose isomerase [Nocardiopsis sp. L17-MgMaSL7]
MHAHMRELSDALTRTDVESVEHWGHTAAPALASGKHLFACGNGGSAAEAQHLTAELTGRFERERAPLSALALHAETSSLTAIANDYGYRYSFARQLRAHASEGDILVCLSTSGASENVVEAARAARELGVVTWSLTGPEASALSVLSDEAVGVPAVSASTIQEVHLALVHVFCAAVDHRLERLGLALEVPVPRRTST